MSEGSAVAAKIFTWDWQEQPDMAAIAEAVHEVSGGRVHMREVDTGSDQYEWIVSDYPVDDAEAERLTLAPPRLVAAVFNDRFVGFKRHPDNSAQKIARN